MKKLLSRLNYSNVTATIAVILGLTGTAWALSANSVGPRQIKPNAVKTSEIANGAVGTEEVKDGTLKPADFGQLPAGPQGPAGADGTELTPAQALDKIKQVDGPGSGLDADSIDGVDSSGLGRAYTVHRTASGTSGNLPLVDLPLGPVGSIEVVCSLDLADAMVLKYTSTGAPGTINFSAVTSGVESADPDLPSSIDLENGVYRDGRLLGTDNVVQLFLPDTNNGAASQLTLVVQKNGLAAVATLHLFYNDSSPFCEMTGSVVTGPAL